MTVNEKELSANLQQGDEMIDKRFWQMALDVQSACNLSGVVFSFVEAMRAICDEAALQGKGTDWKNEHPICVLFATQIGHLTHVLSYVSTDVYDVAYKTAIKEVEK